MHVTDKQIEEDKKYHAVRLHSLAKGRFEANEDITPTFLVIT